MREARAAFPKTPREVTCSGKNNNSWRLTQNVCWPGYASHEGSQGLLKMLVFLQIGNQSQLLCLAHARIVSMFPAHSTLPSRHKCKVPRRFVSSELTALLVSCTARSWLEFSSRPSPMLGERSVAASKFTEKHQDVLVSDPSVLSKQMSFPGTSARTSRTNGKLTPCEAHGSGHLLD